jgi:hypothetical protein
MLISMFTTTIYFLSNLSVEVLVLAGGRFYCLEASPKNTSLERFPKKELYF